MAASLLQEISQDERERAIQRSRRMFETDMISDLLTAEERGEIRGKEQEREKWQALVADKDIKLADKDAEIEQLRLQIEKLKKH